MKAYLKLPVVILWASACLAQAGEIDGRAVVGGALGGGAGAAIGSAVGGREGAIIGAGVGGAAGAAIATKPARQTTVVQRATPVVVEKEVIVEREVVVRERDCWPPGHCKRHRKSHRHHD